VTSTGHGTSEPVVTKPSPPIVTTARRRGWKPHLGAVVVLLIGLVITATLSIGTESLREQNEDRLLRQRVHEAAAVATAAIPNVQVPLSAAAILAQRTRGAPGAFEAVVGPAVNTGIPFVSASLWRLGDAGPQRVTVVGANPLLAQATPAARGSFLQRAATSDVLLVRDMLQQSPRRLGYATHSADGRYVAYAEATLPRDRRARIDKDSAFADLDYALYLGPQINPDRLLASSVGGQVPLPGRKLGEAVPFGDKKLFIVLAPRSALGGTFLAWLPWVLGAAGVVLTLGAAALAEWLIRRRERAVALAAELETIAAANARLLADQRTVAATLQHSLLPEELPDVAGLELGVRYVAGVEGVDVGGDWYDVVTLDDGRLFFVVGDVSGRGLRAATVMASLRYAIRAYAAQGDEPAAVLTKLTKLLSVARDGAFATVLCGIIDVERHEAILASAGHPYPLLVANGRTEFVPTRNGVPVGVTGSEPYESVTASIPASATLLVFTDGLVERRGEALDVGFQRLRDSSVGFTGSLEDLLTKIVRDAEHAGSQDDTAVLGIRWRS
jgi:serine phosphatase RsbU (regulator of sigma subunit)